MPNEPAQNVATPRRARSLGAISLVSLALWPSLASAAEDVELRAYLNEQCIVADEPYYVPPNVDGQRFFAVGELIVRQIAGALLQRVISGITTSLRSGAARKDTTFVLAEGMHLYRADLAQSPTVEINPAFGCVTLVAGRFRPQACASEYVPRILDVDSADLPHTEWRTTRADDSIENKLKRANVCLDGPARSVLEARVELSHDRTAFRLNRAGLWIKGLLSSSNPRATRHVFYTVDLYEPGSSEQGGQLATLWMNVGTVKSRDGLVSERAASTDWVRVPRLSGEAAAAFERDAAVHQDLYAEIGALDRAVTRDRRLLDGLQRRLETASDNARAAMQGELDALEIRILKAESMLEALTLEYAELDRPELRYMPVNIEIGITESKSENRAMLALAEIVEANRDNIAAVASEAAGFSRALDAAEQAPPSELSASRDAYFDALVAAKTEADTDAGALARAKARYNAARAEHGLEPVE